jgi:hypothetical protein
VAPYLKGWWKALPWALAAAVCLSRAYLGAHFASNERPRRLAVVAAADEHT